MSSPRRPSRDLGGNWGQGGHWIRTVKRHQIYARDGQRCIWCDCLVYPGDNASLDHIIPRERGGNNQASNLVTACIPCNAARGEEPPILFVFRTQDGDARFFTLDRLIEAMAKPLPDASTIARRPPKGKRAARG